MWPTRLSPPPRRCTVSEIFDFLELTRQEPGYRSVEERICDFKEIPERLSPDELIGQASRCMDCGIPFCHAFGCPLANRIPDWNDMLCQGKWEQALRLLHATNNFPGITGRICPAPCETACTLAVDFGSVTIRQIELELVERGWKEGWIKPQIPAAPTGFRVGVIGSGPAGLAAAQELARRGHEVIVFEKAERPGGILRYGIPDFKLEKLILDRRLEQLVGEGIIFETGVEAGVDLSARYLSRSFDAVIVSAGAGVPRDLTLPGRLLPGIHFAMDYLSHQNRLNSGELTRPDPVLNASGKRVVVLGGGDTGSDCVGTARRQGAKSIIQIEIMDRPHDRRSPDNPWPTWPNIFRTSTSQEEGCERIWSTSVLEFIGPPTGVEKIGSVKLDWSSVSGDNSAGVRKVPDSNFELPADLIIIAAGFTHTDSGSLIQDMELELNKDGNIIVDSSFATRRPGVFAAGDCVSGASLVVHAIDQGRRCALAVNEYLSHSAIL